jgi:CubicO group peptidase (beta-lactamase class C family)
MAKSLTETHAAAIRAQIDQFTSAENKIPGCVCVIVGEDGKPIFQHASGTRGIGTKEPVTFDSIFWIASCTKLVASIAAMQLVEKGTLALDDADQVEALCPELKSVRILTHVDDQGKAELVDKKSQITLRMLLTHTGKFSIILKRNLSLFIFQCEFD